MTETPTFAALLAQEVTVKGPQGRLERCLASLDEQTRAEVVAAIRAGSVPNKHIASALTKLVGPLKFGGAISADMVRYWREKQQ